MHVRAIKLMRAVVIVAVALAGAIWLEDSQQFPWILFVALTFPALAIVDAAGGGPHAVSGEPYVGAATFFAGPTKSGIRQRTGVWNHPRAGHRTGIAGGKASE